MIPKGTDVVKKDEDGTDEDSDYVECVGVVPSTNNAPSASISATLRDSDVACVHGDTILEEHPGNVAYRRLINLNKGVYANANSLAKKLEVAKSIFATVVNSHGRFLERQKNDSGIITCLHKVKWNLVGKNKAIELTLNALREGHHESHQKTARAPPSATAVVAAPTSTSLAPAAEQPKSALNPRNENPTPVLIKLTTEQAALMKYPVGCPIWYNIHINAAKLTTPQSMPKNYSPFGDANIGLVTSVSMDIGTRNILYEVCPAKCVGGVFNSSGGASEEGLFLEDQICYASKCPVQVQLDKPMDGEVITCSFSSGWPDNFLNKSYMVAVGLSDNHVQFFHAVSEDHIKYRPVDTVTEDIIDHNKAKKVEESKDLMHLDSINNQDSIDQKEPDEEKEDDDHDMNHLADRSKDNAADSATKDSIGISEGKEDDEVDSEMKNVEKNAEKEVEENADQTKNHPADSDMDTVESELEDLKKKEEHEKNATEDELQKITAQEPSQAALHPPEHSNQAEGASSPTRSISSSTKPTRHGLFTTSTTSAQNLSKPKLTASSKWDKKPDTAVPLTNRHSRWGPLSASTSPHQTTPSEPPLPNSDDERLGTGHQHPSEPSKRSDDGNTKKRYDSREKNGTARSFCWEPPTTTTLLNSNDPSRKRPISCAHALSSNVAESVETSQPPSKCIKTSKGDGYDDTNKGISVEQVADKSEYSRLLTVLSDHDKRHSSSNVKIIQLPTWLVPNESSRIEVIEAINHSIENIYRNTGCSIRINLRSEKNATQVLLSVCGKYKKRDHSTREAIEIVENCLVKLIGREECRGRLLYDIERSYKNMKHQNALFQRNPQNSSERIWMNVVELPNEVFSNGKVAQPFFRESNFHESIHQIGCTLIICQDRVGARLFRCQPYVLVLGKQQNQVNHAVSLTRIALKELLQSNIERPHCPEDEASKLDPSLKPENDSKSNCKLKFDGINPRKLVIPVWLLSDDLYLKKIEDGLFESEWCKDIAFLDKTGCELVRSQHYLLIKAPSNAERWPNINRATHLIEDALLDILGVEDSKCMLLYDLTRSFTKHPIDGIVRIRNPFDSGQRVWANIVDFSGYNNGKNTLMSKKVNEEIHRYQCNLKICGKESFGIVMRHCKPYAMVFGRQKTNVAKAVDFVRRSIKNHSF